MAVVMMTTVQGGGDDCTAVVVYCTTFDVLSYCYRSELYRSRGSKNYQRTLCAGAHGQR